MAWRLANSLKVLLAEVNAAAPNRRKSYDGTIGDAAHSVRASRHNPNAEGVVTALDITHDPAGGMDAHSLARRLVLRPHPNLAYIISNRESARRSTGWLWKPYYGSSAHDKHIHVAVGTGTDSNPRRPYDNETPWGVAESEVDMTPEESKMLKQLRVSDIARSFDVEIIKRYIIGDMAGATTLEAKKKADVAAEKARLGV